MNPLIQAFCKHNVSIATFYTISFLFIGIIQIFMAFVHRLAFCCFMSAMCCAFFVFSFLSLFLFRNSSTNFYRCVSGATRNNCTNQSEKSKRKYRLLLPIFFLFFYLRSVSLGVVSCCSHIFSTTQSHFSVPKKKKKNISYFSFIYAPSRFCWFSRFQHVLYFVFCSLLLFGFI